MSFRSTLRHVLPTSSHERDSPLIASRRPPVTRLLSCCLALFACILAATTPAAFAARQTAETATQAPAPPPSTDDTAASRQLQARLATDEDLDEVTASVDNGVAELDGTVLQPAHRQEAGKIATGTPGVEPVVNNVEVDDSLGDRKSKRLHSSH